jgi:5-methylcytosine-specific restriction protein B
VTHHVVDAVFFWRYPRASVHKPVYGRIPPQKSYTKDYLQPNAALASVLKDVLGQPEQTVEWRWPGGSDPGGKFLAHGTEGTRLDLRWTTAKGAPTPWRLTPHPSATTIETLAGDPGKQTEAEADAEIASVIAADETPWLLAVHLAGEGALLHPRVVLENPGPGRDFASWNALPDVLRNAMQQLGTNEIQGYYRPEGGPSVRAQAIVDQVLAAFKTSPNVLLVGPPGTGKTVAMEDIREAFAHGTAITFDPDLNHGAFQEGTSVPTEVRTVVFHPSYAYEHFVIGLLPDLDPASKQVVIKPHVGPLIELAVYASQVDRRALLVCDEFNRGNAAAIFGDTLALLDADKRSDPAVPGSGAVIDTPFHHLAPQTLSGHALDAHLRLPQQLFVLAAMNSADRSVAPLDAALRRRFAIIYVGPNYDVLRAHLGVSDLLVNQDGDTDPGPPGDWTSSEHGFALAVAVLEKLNARIEAVLGRDFLLGHSVMWHVSGGDLQEVLRSVAHALDTQVTGTLQLSFVDNDAALAAVLNAPIDPAATASANAAASWHQPPGDTAEVAPPRLRIKRFSQHTDAELVALLSALLE